MKILEYWYIILALSVLVTCAAVAVNKFYRLPRQEQVRNVKQWLLWAVTMAEKELGGGTGQLKLRFVYDWAVERFKWIAFVPFATFSGWVDEALEQMKKQLVTNEAVKHYIVGE